MIKNIYHLIFILFITTTVYSNVPEDSFCFFDSLKTGSQILISDSASVADTIVSVKSVPDTLKPVFKKPVITQGIYSHNLSKSDILQSDYRSASDLVDYIPFGYTSNLGIFGSPNESLFYGYGNDNVSFLRDDLQLNNRANNSYNIHLFPSESIENISLLPATRGFLLNNSNNPVSLNFITQDRIDVIPYSRIRYYQGSDEEGFIDAIFSAYVTSRLNVSIEISNLSKSKTFDNTDYSNWTAFTKLHYMLSNRLNLVFSYSHNTVRTSLNGGIDYQAILPTNFNTILYDPLTAPVNYEDRYLKQNINCYSLQVLGNLINNLPATLSFYYQNGLNEYRQNEYNHYPTIDSVKNNASYKVYGVHFNQSVNTKYADLDVIVNYEHEKTTSSLYGDKTLNSLSTAGIASLKLFENTFTPNVFLKHLSYNEKSYFGFGADLSINIGKHISLYEGLATFAKPYSFQIKKLLNSSNESSKFYILETGVKYQTELVNLSLSLVNIKEDGKPVAIGNSPSDSLKRNTVVKFETDNINRTSISLSGSIQLWNILLQTNTTYHLVNNSQLSPYPDLTFNGGLYYKDILFDSNLDLKAGFNFYLWGERDYFNYDFEKSLAYTYTVGENGNRTSVYGTTFSTDYRVDLFISGTIQKSATLFFTMENLLGKDYFVVPYYPMPGRTIRFGVSWEFLN